jgi:hypothetical protein
MHRLPGGDRHRHAFLDGQRRPAEQVQDGPADAGGIEDQHRPGQPLGRPLHGRDDLGVSST